MYMVDASGLSIDTGVSAENRTTTAKIDNFIEFQRFSDRPGGGEIARLGIAILMVEQNARQALNIADKGFVLVQGENRYTDTGAALLADPSITVHAHDLKRQLVVGSGFGLPCAEPCFDTLVAAYLLDAGQRSYSLADIAQRHHVPAPAELPLADATSTPEEAAAVATAVLAVAGPMREALEAAGLSDLFTSVEMPLVGVLADIELRGVRVDTPTLARLSQSEQITASITRGVDFLLSVQNEDGSWGSPKRVDS